MNTPLPLAAFTLTAIDAVGRRRPIDATALEISLTDGSGVVLLESSPPEAFAGQLVLRAEPAPGLLDSHFCALVVRPGACNVLHLGLESLPAADLDEAAA
jgi:hypothetical protein